MSSPVRPPSEKTMLAVLVALVAVLGVLAGGSALLGPASAPAPTAAPAPVAAPAVEPAAVTAPAPVVVPAPAVAPAPVVAPAAPAVPALADGTPCSSTADACVDLSSRRAWLLDGAGNVTYGPVGALGGTRRDPTPTGTFSVDYKDRDHVSNLFDADMPNSVFFAPAIAFHQGSLSQRSHGCIHLGRTASQRFFSNLSPGDTVQVVS